ncbi:disulfide isomerase-like protein 1-6 [Tanacetum coccineum]
MHVCHLDSILLSAYAPLIPQLLSLPLSMTLDDSDRYCRFDVGLHEAIMSLGVGKFKDDVICTWARQLTEVAAMADVLRFATLLSLIYVGVLSLPAQRRFAEAATEMREMKSGVLMSKVDAERCPKAASLLGIKGYPTLLLFVNRSSQAYTGGFST